MCGKNFTMCIYIKSAQCINQIDTIFTCQFYSIKLESFFKKIFTHANFKYTKQNYQLHSSLCYTLHLQNLVILHNWNSVPLTNISPFLLFPNHLHSASIISTFLDSTYRWNDAIFKFLCLAHFTWHNVLQVHQCCKWQYSLY